MMDVCSWSGSGAPQFVRQKSKWGRKKSKDDGKLHSDDANTIYTRQSAQHPVVTPAGPLVLIGRSGYLRGGSWTPEQRPPAPPSNTILMTSHHYRKKWRITLWKILISKNLKYGKRRHKKKNHFLYKTQLVCFCC